MSSIAASGQRSAKRRLTAAIAAVVVALDATTKAIVVHALAGRGLVNLLGGHFHLELYRNFAGPGNILQGHTVLVSVLSLCAVALMVVAVRWVRTTSSAVAADLSINAAVIALLVGLVLEWYHARSTGADNDAAAA